MLYVAIAIVAISSFVVSAIYWNEARKEVRYLCGNFTSGVSKNSVIRQLNTANLANYQLLEHSNGSQIIFSSKLNFRIYTCIISLNASGIVTRASYE